jgi:hypothetical protein
MSRLNMVFNKSRVVRRERNSELPKPTSWKVGYAEEIPRVKHSFF